MQRNPVGYKKLLTWRQAGEVYRKTKDFTTAYLDRYRDSRLLAHMNDSARSVQRNIEEGFKRITTKEYIDFLGFSRASLEELKRDFEELRREYKEGIRRENKGKEGVIGEIEGLLKLIYGQDCMMGRQINSLEIKVVNEKAIPQNQRIKKVWDRAAQTEKRFYERAKEEYGLERCDDGRFIKVEKGRIKGDKGE